MKRFYEQAGFEPVTGGQLVTLDGKPVRTPGRAALLLPGPASAAAVALEWQAQGPTIKPAEMRLTRLATTVVDLMPARRGDVVQELGGHALTDLLCYRAAEPTSLRLRQTRLWQPWLDRAAERWGAPLASTYGLEALSHPEASLAALAGLVGGLDDWRLVGAHAAVTGTGSLVLGLAMVEGAIDARQAFEAALLEELFNGERWGQDQEQLLRQQRIRADLETAERFLTALRSDLPNG